MRAIAITQPGGPEVLQIDDVAVGEPGAGQIRIRHTAVGVNFLDTYQRSGLYPMPLPQTAGNEGAGVVEAVGLDQALPVLGLRLRHRPAAVDQAVVEQKARGGKKQGVVKS